MQGSDRTFASGCYLVGKDCEYKTKEGVLRELRDSGLRDVGTLTV